MGYAIMSQANHRITPRSPEQASLVEAMYQALVNNDVTGNKSLIEGDGLLSQPYIYVLDAPTGWGKSISAIEPLRMLTNKLRSNIEPLSFGDIDEDSADPTLLPKAVVEGSVGIFVRTRSQTQAFLKEAKKLGIKSLALPSKASVCLHGRVPAEATLGTEDFEVSMERGNAYNTDLLQGTSSALDQIKVPTIDLANYQAKYVNRLYSRCSNQCGKCNLNGKNIEKINNQVFEQGKTLHGDAAEEFLINQTYGYLDQSQYAKRASDLQIELQDLEEATKQLWMEHPNICPYPYIRDSLPEYHFLILTYPYIFNSHISSSLEDKLQHIKHVIIDEAHNIDNLFESFSSRTYLTEDHFEDLSQSLQKFDILEDIAVKDLTKSSTNQLFDKYGTRLQQEIELLQMQLPNSSREYVERAATNTLLEAGFVSPTQILTLYHTIKPIVQAAASWISIVIARYVTFYERVGEENSEKALSAGIVPDPSYVLDMLFGEINVDKVYYGDKAYRNGAGMPFYLSKITNEDKDYLSSRYRIQSFIKLVKVLDSVGMYSTSSLLEKGKKSDDSNIRVLCRETLGVLEELRDWIQELRNIAYVLAVAFPEEVGKWYHANRLNALEVEALLLDNNDYLGSDDDADAIKSYFLNGCLNYRAALKQVYERLQIIDETFTTRESKMSIEIGEILYSPMSQELIVQTIDIVTRYNRDVAGRIGEPEIQIPVYAYSGRFPRANWRIYYKYWDNHFHMVPLTLGKILANQFQQFESICLLSGTFPSKEVMKALWGLNTVDYVATETVGKKTTTVITNVSSKYYDRTPQMYSKFAWTTILAFKSSSKNVLAAFPSKAFAKEVILSMPTNLGIKFWPDRQMVQNDMADVSVPDMLKELAACQESGERKIFFVAMGSRLTEGVEYIDAEKKSMIDSVVIGGIPFPPPDIFQEDSSSYLQWIFNISEEEAYDILTMQNAFQKIRQAIGRSIRSNADEVKVYLADSRFLQNNWLSRLKPNFQDQISEPVKTSMPLPTPPNPNKTSTDYLDDDLPF